ncbi:MAG TPA: ribonuclease III [Thermoanaerobacterales bacterium]|jgi:ribonuclease-3|nr:ribonuclease III [Thermoanaerobacterales bacterium]
MMLNRERIKQLDNLQKKIDIYFCNQELLNTAFIHPSFTNENDGIIQQSNQRLEFLGDAVLDLIVSQYLFEKHSDLSEGQMTKIRALTVCESSLAKKAYDLGLGDYLILGKGEEHTNGRQKPSILCDTFEALVGAIYIDKSYETAWNFVITNLEQVIKRAIEGEWKQDFKTNLQESLQKLSNDKILYRVIKEKGPDHNKIFYVEVIWKNKVLGKGIGRNKKEAEQRAAKHAIKNINRNKTI